jgi:hypothetical protein
LRQFILVLLWSHDIMVFEELSFVIVALELFSNDLQPDSVLSVNCTEWGTKVLEILAHLFNIIVRDLMLDHSVVSLLDEIGKA